MQIFISYRRSCSWGLARLIYEELIARGYDVFMDIKGIRRGDFEKIIYENIGGCDYFLPIFSKDTFCEERLNNPEDWIRKEIEYALTQNKDIVPIIEEGYKPPEDKNIPSPLIPVFKLNGAPFNNEFFEASIEKLINDFLIEKMTTSHISIETINEHVFREEDFIDRDEYIIASYECEVEENKNIEEAF
jgi:hypothetical protein